ncbi:MAG: hypothetical protein K2F92_02245 [Alistipes sp.]|nr:hypothetical protein [Alistipes sp.]
MTPRELYEIAMRRNLQDAHIRICDGMAVSYYPDPRSICRGRYEVVIDVSALQPIEFDDLDAWAVRQYDHDREIDVEVERVERIRTTQARRNACGPQIKKITPDTPTDELPWEIYRYGPRRKQHVR